MKLQEARKDVLLKLAIRCGFEVPEYRLSGETRQEITTLASSYRQLFALRDLVNLERENDARLSSRARRRISGKVDTDLSEHLRTIETTRGKLDEKISDVAARIVAEVTARPARGSVAAPPATASASSPILEPLRCPSCGADMGMPTSSLTKCKYCGTTYTIGDYLRALGANLSSGVRPQGDDVAPPRP